MTDHAVPNLPSGNFDETGAFYGKLGFGREYRDEGWLILQRGGLRLEFFLFPGLVPEESSFMCSFRVDDLDWLYGQIREAGVVEETTGRPRLHPAQLQPWGQRAASLSTLTGHS